jgi:molecular chaperone GrpE
MMNRKENEENKNGKHQEEVENIPNESAKAEKNEYSDEQLEISTEHTPEDSEDKDERTTTFEAVVAELENSLATINDKYLRLSAEFDNYRKRTLREKMELTRSAGESVMRNVLPLIDDVERAVLSMENGLDLEATKEGVKLIYNKFKDFATQNGIKEMEALGEVFNTDLHEAITKVPAPSDELKGKIIDVIQKGYYLNDKVIRFAKVIVGE